jgi:hypothetical protein
VSALAFMRADASTESITARTPMERRARAAGASFGRRDGWNVAVGYGDPDRERRWIGQTVGFADRSSLAKLELQAEPAVLGSVVAAASDDLELKLGTASLANGTWWCPVTPSRVLVLAESSVAGELRGTIDDAVARAGGVSVSGGNPSRSSRSGAGGASSTGASSRGASATTSMASSPGRAGAWASSAGVEDGVWVSGVMSVAGSTPATTTGHGGHALRNRRQSRRRTE